MKILHVSAAVNWGGGENHLVNLCHELQPEAGIQNHVLCVRNSILMDRLLERDIPFTTAPLANQMDPRYIFKLVRLCKKQKFDLVHIHDSIALTLTVMADHFCDLPDLIFSKKTSFPIRFRKQTLYKYNYPKIKKILCVSEATREVLSKSVIGKERFEVIYHGTGIHKKALKIPFSAANRIEVPKGKIVIGNIANHIEAKHLETFIHTVHQLVHVKNQEHFHFVQIGKFTRRTKNLMKLVRDLKLENHMSFAGYLPEASQLIAQLDVMLITSENEGIPQVIYEAFYHGVPIISTEVGGISEVIEHNKNGLLSKVHDYEDLAENILFLMDNPQLIPTFAEVSKEKLLKSFTSEKMAKKTLEVFKKVLNARHQ